jgi:hypothetical protein
MTSKLKGDVSASIKCEFLRFRMKNNAFFFESSDSVIGSEVLKENKAKELERGFYL